MADSPAGRVPPRTSRTKYRIPTIGEVFEVPYPFTQDTWQAYEADECGAGSIEVPTWKPGPHNVERETPWSRRGEEAPDVVSVADAMGAQLIIVVGVYRPGRFPTRVFYVRQWRDPDGKVFGKTNCRQTTVPSFVALVRGYRHDYEVVTKPKEFCHD